LKNIKIFWKSGRGCTAMGNLDLEFLHNQDNLVSQLNSFIEKGFWRGRDKAKPRYGPFILSNEFFDLFKIALKLAQQGNIGVRIAEDFGLPWNNLFERSPIKTKKLRAQRLRLDHAELISGKRVF